MEDHKKKSTGRPSTYTPEITAEICRRLAGGQSLRSICGGSQFPDASTVHRWLNEHEDFREHYAHARIVQADYYAEQVVDIADDVDVSGIGACPECGVVSGEDPKRLNAMVQKARLQADSRKWVAARMSPKRWGDRTRIDLGGEVAIRIEDARETLNSKLDRIRKGSGLDE